MATVNKQSLREEFDALKAEFERLTANGKMAAESRALFRAMLMLFEVLMAVFMERRTPKDSPLLEYMEDNFLFLILHEVVYLSGNICL